MLIPAVQGESYTRHRDYTIDAPIPMTKMYAESG